MVNLTKVEVNGESVLLCNIFKNTFIVVQRNLKPTCHHFFNIENISESKLIFKKFGCPICVEKVGVREKKQALRLKGRKESTEKSSEWMSLFELHPQMKTIPYFIFVLNINIFSIVIKSKTLFSEFLTTMNEKRMGLIDTDYSERVLNSEFGSITHVQIEKLTRSSAIEFTEIFSPKRSEKNPSLEVRSVYYFDSHQLGVFTSELISKGTFLGTWTGLVIQSMNTPVEGVNNNYIWEKQLKSKVSDLEFTYAVISIDPTRTWVYGTTSPSDLEVVPYFGWNSRLNHKWSWKIAVMNINIVQIPEKWIGLFSNVDITSEDLKMTASSDINMNDELFLDYGFGYWGKNEKPLWDMKSAPPSFINFLKEVKFQNLPEDWKNILKVLENQETLKIELNHIRFNILSLLKKSVLVNDEELKEHFWEDLKEIPEKPTSFKR